MAPCSLAGAATAHLAEAAYLGDTVEPSDDGGEAMVLASDDDEGLDDDLDDDALDDDDDALDDDDGLDVVVHGASESDREELEEPDPGSAMDAE